MYTTDHHLEQQKLDTNYHINRQLFVIVLISPVVAQFGAEPKTTIWGMESRRWRRKALVQRKGPGSLTGGPGLPLVVALDEVEFPLHV